MDYLGYRSGRRTPFALPTTAVRRPSRRVRSCRALLTRHPEDNGPLRHRCLPEGRTFNRHRAAVSAPSFEEPEEVLLLGLHSLSIVRFRRPRRANARPPRPTPSSPNQIAVELPPPHPE